MLVVGTEREKGKEACLLPEEDEGDRPALGLASTPSPLTPEP